MPGVPQAHMSMIDGGEVAMWSDQYCPAPGISPQLPVMWGQYCAAPGCAINGSYSWLADPAQDKLFEESYGNMVCPELKSTDF